MRETVEYVGYYCQLFGVTMPDCDLSQGDFFLLFSPSEVRVLDNRRSKLLGQIVGSAMKSGVVLHLRDGVAKGLEWDTWRAFWRDNFAPVVKARKNRDPEPYTPPRKKRGEENVFQIMQGRRSKKRPQSHGYERTYIANKSMDLYGTPIPVTPLSAQ